MMKEKTTFFILELIVTALLAFKLFSHITEFFQHIQPGIKAIELFIAQLFSLGVIYLISTVIVGVIRWFYHAEKAETILRKRHKAFFKKYDEDLVALSRSFCK